jgi:hypothetical protein
VGTALSWIQPDFKVYPPSGFARAAHFLGIPDEEHSSLLGAVHALDRSMHLQAVAELDEGGFELHMISRSER